MVEQLRVLMPTEAVGLCEAADIDDIECLLNAYVQDHNGRLNLEILNGWRLLFDINSRATSAIGVYKRAQRYPSDQEFEISISITIPNEDEASYGLASVKESYFLPLNEKKFHILAPVYDSYSNLNDYILESGKRALQLAFTAGLVINGKKLQLRE